MSSNTVAVVILGAAYLPAIGQTTQLAANATLTTGTVQAVTKVAVWQSSNTAVVAVSNGLVTAVGLGTSAVTATYQGKSATQQVSVGATSHNQIGSCGAFTGAGPFTVTNDIKVTSTDCLMFFGTPSAQLDCQGHDVSSLTLVNVQNFSVRNCLMHASLPGTLHVLNSSGVTIAASDVIGTVKLENTQSTILSNSTFRWPTVGAGIGVACNYEVYLGGGQNNTLVQSTVDGGSNGSPDQQQGCDDGVLIYQEANSVIQGNNISGAWDAGIEAVGSTPVTAVIAGNTISRAGVAGIAGYYVMGWQNSAFSSNTVSGTPRLIMFYTSLLPAQGAGTVFMNNKITNNTLLGPSGASMLIDFVSGGLPYRVSGNLIQGNNFGTGGQPPVLLPAGGFIDGGGNTCQTGGVLACNGMDVTWLSVLLFDSMRPARPYR